MGSGARVIDDLGNVRRLASKLRENLLKCADDPGEDPVHDTRTGTRRLQATLEDLVREIPAGDVGEPVRDAAMAAMKLLKRIRHEAGPVRDLDVHRKLIEKLMKRAAGPSTDDELENAAVTGQPVVEPSKPKTGIEKQADDLDAWLKHRRSELVEGLKAQAKEFAEKLDKRLEELETALQARHARRAGRARAKKKPPGVVALDSFARLASEMQVLDAGNLHDFRKGAKKARYVAELAAQGDAQAQQVGETLKKLQDEIGDWHDWLVLADEAHTALGDEATELSALIEAERERHFVVAMKMAAKLRGRLMGEWLAMRPAFSVRRSAIRKRVVAASDRKNRH
jgi:CHAD domain-containing protein